jgi:hypothetical protein
MKQTDTHSTDPAARVTELMVAITALQQHDRAFLAEQLTLERGGATAKEASTRETPATRAQHWLNGHATARPAEDKDARLGQIVIDRAGVALAVTNLQSQLFDAQAEVYRAWMTAHEKDWAAIQRRRAKALLDLREANRAASRFRTAAQTVSPGAVSLPADRISGLFGDPVVSGGDGQYTFLQAVIKAGFIDASEVGPWQ